MYGEVKTILPSSVQKTYLPVQGRKIPRYMGGGIGMRMEIYEILCTPISMVPRLHQSNGCIRRNYVYRELKNVLPSSVQKMYLPVRGCKMPRHMWGGMGSRMEICQTSCTPIPMVLHLHQSNCYIKGKLRVWRAQKCIALIGAENVLTSEGS